MSSCSISKGLEEGQSYYTGAELTILDPEKMESVSNLGKELDVIPQKGTSFGLFNINLGFYNIYQDSVDGGFKHWVKYSLGKEPVLYDHNILEVLQARLDYHLKGKGFFSNEVACRAVENDWKTKIECNINLGNRSQIDTVVFPVDSTYAALRLDALTKRAILREGSYYDRNKLAYERTRLVTMARDAGFAGFAEDDIIYYVDTLAGPDIVDLYLEILQPTDSTIHTRYDLQEIHLYPNHGLSSDDTTDLRVRSLGDDIYVHERNQYADDWLWKRMITEETGRVYKASAEKSTINRFLDLGMFSFVNVKNRTQGKGKHGYIRQDIFFTPQNMQSISGELELNNRSGNFFGTGLSAIYHHRNLFGGGEQFRLSLGGQVEAQFGEGLSFINTSDLSVDGELTYPRFIVPFLNVKEGNRFVPRTVINGNFTLQRRVQYYTLQSSVVKYGFRWQETARKTHELFPISINTVAVYNKTDAFSRLLVEDPRLERSFSDISILGLQYFFTYNNQSNRRDKNYRYFRAELETSGNLLGWVIPGNAETPSKIMGQTYAQFVKLTLDYRRYYDVGPGQLAMRALIGGGYAYGNSAELPVIKQYLAGGSNSVRAFRLRGLGPGSFARDPSVGEDPFLGQFLDQTGDVKIECNIEYRFPIFSYLKGALFMDAGNIWLVNSNDLPIGNFSFDDFYREIGVGTGFGFRLDFEFFLIRLDLAFPVRAPVYQEGFSWRFSDIDFSSASWRRENLRYNLGIGYPF